MNRTTAQPAVSARPEDAATTGQPGPPAQAAALPRARRFRRVVTQVATAAVAGLSASVPF